MSEKDTGEKGAYRTALLSALYLMNPEQLSALHKQVSQLHENTKLVQSAGDMPFLEGVEHGCDVIDFLIAQALDIARGTESEAKEFHLICTKCGFPIGSSSGTKPCAKCGSTLIDIDRIERPED